MATVTVYTLPSCRQCDMTKKWLAREGVPYGTVDLSEDPQALEAVKALGYNGAPVVIVNDDGDLKNEKHWYGFRPDMLKEFTTTKEAAA